jgi:hypothetical protein
MDDDRHFVAGGALRLHQVAEETLHAAGRGREVLANVENPHQALTFFAPLPDGFSR